MCKGSPKPPHKQNFSRSIDIHLGKLKNLVEQYEQGIRTLDGLYDDSFPPFRNKKEAVDFGRSAGCLDILRVLNLWLYLERQQKQVQFRDHEKRLRLSDEKPSQYEILLLSTQIEQCRYSIKAYETRFLVSEEKNSDTMLFDETFDSWYDEEATIEEI